MLNEPPAVAVCEVKAFERPGCLIEIDAIAVVSPDRPGWDMKKYPMLYGGVKQSYPGIGPGNTLLLRVCGGGQSDISFGYVG